MNKSFTVNLGSLHVLDNLTDEQAGKLFKALYALKKGEEIHMDSMTIIAIAPFKSQHIRQKANSINGAKGGRPKKDTIEKQEVIKPNESETKANQKQTESEPKANEKPNESEIIEPKVAEPKKLKKELSYNNVIFEKFRQKYLGNKKGNETEFNNFCKHKDWKEVLLLLEPAIDNQILERQKKIDNKQFVPEWKHLQTWINKRCWEEEMSKEIITTNNNNNVHTTKELTWNTDTENTEE